MQLWQTERAKVLRFPLASAPYYLEVDSRFNRRGPLLMHIGMNLPFPRPTRLTFHFFLARSITRATKTKRPLAYLIPSPPQAQDQGGLPWHIVIEFSKKKVDAAEAFFEKAGLIPSR